MANITQNEDLIAAKTRLTTAKAEQAEIKLAVMRGEFVPLSEVNKHWADQAGRVKAKLSALPSRLTHQLVQMNDHAEIFTLLTVTVNEALSELAGGYEPEQ